ncbi:MAG: hypothetical protein SR3Q1_09590 [Quinella sp. 3Q1]|nr:hypothetical protein [Quinella sp. 3Q1]MBR6887044.1 hypothetical protein [Selenomonadaceae bacterium]
MHSRLTIPTKPKKKKSALYRDLVQCEISSRDAKISIRHDHAYDFKFFNPIDEIGRAIGRHGREIFICEDCREAYYGYCEHCLNEYYRLCEKCDEYCRDDLIEDGLCPDCRAEQ